MGFYEVCKYSNRNLVILWRSDKRDVHTLRKSVLLFTLEKPSCRIVSPFVFLIVLYVLTKYFAIILSVRRGEGRSTVGALPPYLPTHCYILISYTQHLPSLPQANVSAPCLVSNCPIIRGILLGSMNSLTTIYFFIPCLFKSYLLGCQELAPHRFPTNSENASVLF